MANQEEIFLRILKNIFRFTGLTFLYRKVLVPLGSLLQQKKQTILAIFLLVLIISLILILLWAVPEWQVTTALSPEFTLEKRIKLVNETRGTWAQIFVGITGIILLYISWRRITATEKSLKVAQEGQITERFTKAIEQLGSKEQAVRLGGIYSLERIAHDSEKDHWTIIEILTAYVRNNFPYSSSHTEEKNAVNEQPEEATKGKISPLSMEQQAILTVISRRKKEYVEGEKEALNLAYTNLKKSNLYKSYFIKANLEGANLEETDLRETHLEGATLKFANLRNAKLGKAILWKANLLKANLSGVNLQRAILEGANLSGVNLQGANLTRANLEEAHLLGGDLQDTKLYKAKLDKTNLKYTNLSSADLAGTYLLGANFEKAILREANLMGARKLTVDQLSKAKTLYNTNIDPDLMKQVKQKCPHLLEEPKGEESEGPEEQEDN